MQIKPFLRNHNFYKIQEMIDYCFSDVIDCGRRSRQIFQDWGSSAYFMSASLLRPYEWRVSELYSIALWIDLDDNIVLLYSMYCSPSLNWLWPIKGGLKYPSASWHFFLFLTVPFGKDLFWSTLCSTADVQIWLIILWVNIINHSLQGLTLFFCWIICTFCWYQSSI